MRKLVSVFLLLSTWSTLAQERCYLVVKANNSTKISHGIYEVKNTPKQFKDTYSRYKNEQEANHQGLIIWIVEPNGTACTYQIHEEELKNIGEYTLIISGRSYFTNLTHEEYSRKIDSLNSAETPYLPEKYGIYESISFSIGFRYVFNSDLDSSNFHSRITALNAEKTAIDKKIKALMNSKDNLKMELSKIQELKKDLNSISDEIILRNMYPELSNWSYEEILAEKKAIDLRLFSKIGEKKIWRNHIYNYWIWRDADRFIFSFRCNGTNLNLVQNYARKLSRIGVIKLVSITKELINNHVITYW